MTLLAATATADAGVNLWPTIMLGLAYALYHATLCAIRPYKRHRRCRGLGRFPVKGSRVRKDCKGWRGCGGHGIKLRLGRRIYAHLKRRRELGQRRTY